MPPVTVDRQFLHRCCIEFSSALEDDGAVQAETKHALRFSRAHAGTNASELARALVWRIVDTDDANEADRAGAWFVLNSVLAECGEERSELSRTALADKIALFLPYLIAHRWFTTIARRNDDPHLSGGNDDNEDDDEDDDEDGEGLLGDAAAGVGSLHDRRRRRGNRLGINLAAYDKVVPAETITGAEVKPLDRQTVYTLTEAYGKMRASWAAVWRRDMLKDYYRLMDRVSRHGNELTRQAAKHLEIPATFKDSLWRLRRKSPRPSLAYQVLCAYGWNPAPERPTDNNTARPRGPRMPRTMGEVEALDASMHPGVRQWMLLMLEHKGGCRLCDTWLHPQDRCPCENAFLRHPLDEEEDNSGDDLNGHVAANNSGKKKKNRRWFGEHQLPSVGGRRYTYMKAVDRLHSSGLALPLRTEVVLDYITNLIAQEKPYEEVLAAFDTVRGAVTGPEELHSLWLHASYSLLPSKTVFDKPSDMALSPALRKAERFLRGRRRLREWDQLLRSAEVLDAPFRRRALPARAVALIDEVRETSSFFFCLVDGSLPPSYTPGTYARVPEEVVGAARLKDILCRSCLEPFHCMESCPHGKRPNNNGGGDSGTAEPWDLQVARLVLEESGLLDLRSGGGTDAARVAEAMRRIDEDDRQAKEFRKCELRLAVKLMVDGGVPYCTECRVAGHSARRCEARALRVFASERLREVDVRLEPRGLLRKLRDLRQANNDAALGELRDAFSLLASGARAFPRTYQAAIKELDDARVPLAAARYSTDAVQSFLLYINSGDLLAHLKPLRSADFPEVCLFCDSYHHRSEDCTDAKPEESGFLTELRRCGVDLWLYLRRPEYYDQRLPTDYPTGKLSVVQLVRQFDGEYGPGGIARQKFVEHNGLEGAAGLSQRASGLFSSQASQHQLHSQLQLQSQFSSTSFGGGGGGSSSQVAPLYGRSFSQLLEPPARDSAATPQLSTDGGAAATAALFSSTSHHLNLNNGNNMGGLINHNDIKFFSATTTAATPAGMIGGGSGDDFLDRLVLADSDDATATATATATSNDNHHSSPAEAPSANGIDSSSGLKRHRSDNDNSDGDDYESLLLGSGGSSATGAKAALSVAKVAEDWNNGVGDDAGASETPAAAAQ